MKYININVFQEQENELTKMSGYNKTGWRRGKTNVCITN